MLAMHLHCLPGPLQMLHLARQPLNLRSTYTQHEGRSIKRRFMHDRAMYACRCSGFLPTSCSVEVVDKFVRRNDRGCINMRGGLNSSGRNYLGICRLLHMNVW